MRSHFLPGQEGTINWNNLTITLTDSSKFPIKAGPNHHIHKTRKMQYLEAGNSLIGWSHPVWKKQLTVTGYLLYAYHCDNHQRGSIQIDTSHFTSPVIA